MRKSLSERRLMNRFNLNPTDMTLSVGCQYNGFTNIEHNQWSVKMKTLTKTVQLNTDRDEVFDFLSNIENLPLWAVKFCTGVRKEGDVYMASTRKGDIFFSIHADAITGVVDMVSGPTMDSMKVWPARVMALPNDTSLFEFTCVQYDGLPEEEFGYACQAVDDELDGLRARFA